MVRAKRFLPTDLLATSLGSCILTIIGIKAEAMDIDISGTTAEITKVMAAKPRRVSEIHIIVNFPHALDESTLKRFYKTALTCPVGNSLDPAITQNLVFHNGTDA